MFYLVYISFYPNIWDNLGEHVQGTDMFRNTRLG
jgi:hypothetical protein